MATKLQSRSWLEFSQSSGSCWASLSWRSSWRTSPLHLQLFLCNWNQLTLSVSRFVQIPAVLICYNQLKQDWTREMAEIEHTFLSASKTMPKLKRNYMHQLTHLHMYFDNSCQVAVLDNGTEYQHALEEGANPTGWCKLGGLFKARLI